MGKLCILDFGKGKLDEGFNHIRLDIKNDDHRPLVMVTGSLPPVPKIAQLQADWSSQYRGFLGSLSPNGLRSDSLRIKNGKVSNGSAAKRELENLGKELDKQLDIWLREEEFRSIRENLFIDNNRNDVIRLIIASEDTQLQKLPLHRWKFFQEYKYAELAFSSSSYVGVPSSYVGVRRTEIHRHKPRILAIIGEDSELNLNPDLQTLENITGAETVVKIKPQPQQVYEYLLDKKGWDILFFAGHSFSQSDGTSGQIYLNDKESLKVSKLEEMVKEAIDKGLKIAIFNSCDGLGIAQDLAKFYIPYIIIMQEPVTDMVAQEFFQELMTDFRNGNPLHLAVRKARLKLATFQDKYPYASWLPVLFQIPVEGSITWEQLPGSKAQVKQLPQPTQPQQSSQTSRETKLPHDCTNIKVIGDRASGKTTYLATLAYNPNSHLSPIINQITPLNQHTEQLRNQAKNIIEAGSQLPPTAIQPESNLQYALEITLEIQQKRRWHFQSQSKLEPLKVSFQDYPGEYFSTLYQQDNSLCVQNHLADCTQGSKMMLLIAGTAFNKDAKYAQNLKKLLNAWEHQVNNSVECRLAVVFTKCEQPKLLSEWSEPKAMAYRHFPQVYQLLSKWERRGTGKVEYFLTSAFGILGDYGYKFTANSKNIDSDISQESCVKRDRYVIDDGQKWKPINLVVPIYWLCKGEYPQSLVISP